MEWTYLVATTGFCITSSSLSDDTLSESDPVAKKRDIAASYKPETHQIWLAKFEHNSNTIKYPLLG